MGVRHMQGVPAHIEYLKSDSIRRNIAHCKFSKHLGKKNYICICTDSPHNETACNSSSRCDYYTDKRN